MAKIIIPIELKGKDIYPASGKITLDEDMSLKDAKIAKDLFPNIQILEEKPKPKKKKE